MFGWLKRIFKPLPRQCIDISNYWLNQSISDDEGVGLMLKAKAAGYSGVICEALYSDVCNQQLRCAARAGLWADIYPWLSFSKSLQENQQRIKDCLIPGFSGLVWLDCEAGVPDGVDVVAFIQDMVDWCWDNNLRPAIYTRRGWWTTYMRGITRFSNLALWDADPDGLADANHSKLEDIITPWQPYGGWQKRVWKQFAWNHQLAGMNVDLNVEWI